MCQTPGPTIYNKNKNEEEITEGRETGNVSKTKAASPPLTEGLDPPLP